MKVQLIVVQGKPEGKVIPLLGPVFKIGRGETCHLRPNSERVSREHAEFTVAAGQVVVRDLGSRNGTLVNGKALTHPHVLKDRDLVQVGPLTFAVSIEDAVLEVATAPSMPVVIASPPSDPALAAVDASTVSDAPAPSGIRGSETIMIPAFFGTAPPRGVMPMMGLDADDAEYERHPVVDGETVLDIPAVDLSNAEPPATKKSKPEATGKPGDRKGNDAATEILRKMMERGRVSK